MTPVISRSFEHHTEQNALRQNIRVHSSSFKKAWRHENTNRRSRNFVLRDSSGLFKCPQVISMNCGRPKNSRPVHCYALTDGIGIEHSIWKSSRNVQFSRSP
ncbi:hypothetical protein TNCV_527261 [Trichonephila clavipes]|nr:hypothetical protein TNCV_527261 [Trichonephila clavipes]